MAQTYDLTAIESIIQAAGYGADAASVAAQALAITAAFIELSGERAWSWLRTTTTGTLTIADSRLYPTGAPDALQPLAVRLTLSGVPYEPLEQRGADELTRQLHLDLTTTTGVPVYWAWVNRAVQLWPRPDRAYAFSYDYVALAAATSLDSGSEKPPLGDVLAPVIAWGAIRWLAFRQRDQASYTIAATEYTRAKQQIEQLDRAGEPGRVKDWDGWAGVE